MTDHFDHEEDFHALDNKQEKRQRKYLQTSDRSKYKKTDLAQEKQVIDESLPRGRVVEITGHGALVESNGETHLCILRGNLKKEKTQYKNLIVVGDYVRYQDKTIIQIEDRFSILSRTDITGKKEQLIASNIDQLIILVSLVEPPLKPALIDRYLIAAAKGNLSPVIVLNKIDLLPTSEEETHRYHEFLDAYGSLGFPILSISTKTEEGLDELRATMKDKTSVIAGQSGVGKSSLLNVAYNLDLRVGDLAEKTAKGTHTTTTAELLHLPGGGFCIDTPGVRSFGIWSLSKLEVTTHFTDIAKIAKKCHYPDCTHTTEPDCAVLKSLEKGKLPLIRYESYESLLDESTGGIDNRTRKKLEEL